MADQQTIKFFDGVLSKTRKGRIPWGPTAEESKFIAAIGGEFGLSISAADPEDSYGRIQRHYYLILSDRSGVDLTTVTDTDEGIERNEIQELYETARRKALRVDEKIGNVLEVLNRL
jgi:hypothetical protein